MEARGILVFGANHLILRGPAPSEAQARAMVRHWSVIRIGAPAGGQFCKWSISTKEFRENLAWAVVVGTEAQSEAVRVLLEEMAARGVPPKLHP